MRKDILIYCVCNDDETKRIFFILGSYAGKKKPWIFTSHSSGNCLGNKIIFIFVGLPTTHPFDYTRVHKIRLNNYVTSDLLRI